MTGACAGTGHLDSRRQTINDDKPAAPDQGQPAARHNYGAYLLRCWQESDGWRYSLEVIGRGRRQGFAAMPALIAALQSELTALVDD